VALGRFATKPSSPGTHAPMVLPTALFCLPLPSSLGAATHGPERFQVEVALLYNVPLSFTRIYSMRRPSRVKANVVASEVWQRSHALFPFALAWGVVGPGAVWGP
jgi:hypothetical protein